MEIAATGCAAARRMGSRASRPVESVKALQLHEKNCSHVGVESGEDTENDS